MQKNKIRYKFTTLSQKQHKESIMLEFIKKPTQKHFNRKSLSFRCHEIADIRRNLMNQMLIIIINPKTKKEHTILEVNIKDFLKNIINYDTF